MKIHVRMNESNRSLLALVTVMLGFGLFWYWSSYMIPTTNIPTPDPQTNTSLVVLGGGLSSGNGALQNGGYISVLEESLGMDIIRVTKPSLRSPQALGLVDTVLEYNPRIVIIEIGLEDQLIPEIPHHEIQTRLERIINEIHDAGSAVLLLEIPGYTNLHRNLAREYRTGIVKRSIHDIKTNADYMFDEYYPNDRGHQELAQQVAPVLRQMLSQ